MKRNAKSVPLERGSLSRSAPVANRTAAGQRPALLKKRRRADSIASELLILPDGRILVHNLTQPMAGLLRKMNPQDKQLVPRARQVLYHQS